MNKFQLIVLILLKILQNHLSIEQCIVAVQEELRYPHPLILRPIESWSSSYGNGPYHIPSNEMLGNLVFNEHEEAILHCPGSYVNINDHNLGLTALKVICQNQKIFKTELGDETIRLSQVTCGQLPLHSLRMTQRKCYGDKDELEVGFLLDDDVFITNYIVCFDSQQRTTLYTQSNLTGSIASAQHGQPRPFFEEDAIFDLPRPLNDLYHIPRQRATINRQVQPTDEFDVIGQGNKVLTRGHLVPKGDFVYIAQQFSTFHYVNAVPQWKDINNENWNEMEKSLREFVSYRGNEFWIYTGTKGIMTINERPLFLYVDDTLEAIPVPLYFWKLVYDPVSRKGAVFVTQNDPYVRRRPFCRDVCSGLSWVVNWEKDNVDFGVSFCCTLFEFQEHVSFPRFPNNRGLL